jgi:hypothetical protein
LLGPAGGTEYKEKAGAGVRFRQKRPTTLVVK